AWGSALTASSMLLATASRKSFGAALGSTVRSAAPAGAADSPSAAPSRHRAPARRRMYRKEERLMIVSVWRPPVQGGRSGARAACGPGRSGSLRWRFVRFFVDRQVLVGLGPVRVVQVVGGRGPAAVQAAVQHGLAALQVGVADEAVLVERDLVHQAVGFQQI